MTPERTCGRAWQRAGCILLLLLPAALVAGAATLELKQVVGKRMHLQAPAASGTARR